MSHECKICGETFDSKRGLGVHRGRMHEAPYKDKDVLSNLYNQENLSLVEVAERLECGTMTVKRWMDKHNIETEKAPQSDDHPVYHGFSKTEQDIVGSEYEIAQTQIDDSVRGVKIHRLIAVAHGKLDPTDFRDRDVVVHHKSEHGLDNRPDNLEVMSRADHSSHHKGK